jgi:predicted dehydrogenase
MMDSEDLDAAAIASPGRTHYEYLRECIGRGLDVFCEKPFLEPDREQFAGDLKGILDLAGQKGRTLAMNSQWPFCLPYYEELCGRIDPVHVRSFHVRLSPLCTGIGMIPDSAPHALSSLHAALGHGG